MHHRVTIMLLVWALAFGLAGCGKEEPAKPKEVTKEQLQKQAGELLDTAKQFLQQQKDRFLQEANSRLQGLDQRIKELQEKAEQASPEVKDRLQGLISSLKEKQAALQKQLEESRGTAGQAWEELKSGLDQKLKEIDQEAEQGQKI